MFCYTVYTNITFFFSVRANEGDAYVLGALPIGTVVHNIEKEPGLLHKTLL